MNDPCAGECKRTSFSALVPFAGFCESFHDQAIDFAEEQMFIDDSGEILNEKLYEMFYANVNYGYVRNKYAKAYVDALAHAIDIPLDYEEMQSPREYNFTTDRLFAKLDRSSLATMLRVVRGWRLHDKINEWFTSRSGFISHYPNKLSLWPRVSDWDHNQIGCVLACYVDLLFARRQIKDERDIAEEWISMETIQEWLDEATTGDTKSQLRAARALRINDYLRRRQERNYHFAA
jgi:hypothetical protein